MIYKFLILCLLFNLNCNSQTNNFIGKTLLGSVGWMCIEVDEGCAGESYFLELTIEQKSILIKQKNKETITCDEDKITYKNIENKIWKESNGKIILQNKSTNPKYKLISLEYKENNIIGKVEIYGKIQEVTFRELNEKEK